MEYWTTSYLWLFPPFIGLAIWAFRDARGRETALGSVGKQSQRSETGEQSRLAARAAIRCSGGLPVTINKQTKAGILMTSLRTLAIVSVVVLSATPLTAQQLSQYREYPLGSSVASVVMINGVRDSDTKTLHERPAKIQQLEWRAPYVLSRTELADPVHDVSFNFCDDQLYQVIVTYDHDRMDGLTNDDVIGSLSATYGVPSLTRSVRGALPADLPADTIAVARWEDAESLVILTRGIYSAPFQLLVISKTLNARARAAIKQALRLDMQEAPQRERDQRKKEVADAREASHKARIVNKAAFRP